MSEKVNKILNKIKKSKEDPNIDKFDTDLYRFLYVLITRIAITVSFIFAVMYLPTNIITLADFILEVLF